MDADSLAQAYRHAFFAKPPPPPQHLELAVAVLCSSLQFSWRREFFELVDELLQTAQAFLQRNKKLAQLWRVASGKSKSRAKAAAQWQRLKPQRRQEAALYLQLYASADPLGAYLRYRLALAQQAHLGLPIEFDV